MPGAMFCTLLALLFPLIIPKPSEVVTIITHILHRKKLRFTATKSPAQDATVSKGQSPDLSSSLSGFKAQTLNSYDFSE